MKIVYIAAAVLIALAWALTVVLGLSLLIPLVATAVICLAIGGFVLFKKIRDRRAAGQLAQGIQAQAEQYAQQFKPEAQLQMQALQSEFQKGVEQLKGTGLAGGGRAALYRLPWYMIIGPSGAGKTTALEKSGLDFPMQHPKKMRGVGGTRNCDWWLANDAVILDTAGRYATEDQDQDEWFSFLDLTRKYRSKKPINGIIVAIAISDLGNGEDAARELGQTIRMRVDEVMGRLRMSAPVYVMLTKCDLVPGFVDSFGSMGRSERNQAWGFTVSMSEQDAAQQLVEDRMDELLADLEMRALHQGAIEQRLEARERILSFPRQLDHYRSGLSEFVAALFSKNVYQGTPLLRGVFFTSGTQEGRPIDQLIQGVRSALGLPATADANADAVDAKSYFLHDVFRRIMIPDQDLAVRSTQEKKRQTLRDALLVAASVIVGLGAVGLVIFAHLEQKRMADAARAAAVKVTTQTKDYPLLGLHDLSAALPGICGAEDDRRVRLDSAELYEAACKRLVTEMTDHVIEPYADGLSERIAKTNQKFSEERPPTGTAYMTLCRDARDRILLSDRPRKGDESLRSVDEGLRAKLARRLKIVLADSAEKVPDGGAPFDSDAAVDAQLKLYLQLFTQEEPSELAVFGTRYDKEVKDARKLLAATIGPEEFVDKLVEDMAAKHPNRGKRLVKLLGYTGELIFPQGDYMIPPAYTRYVWDNDVSKRLYADTRNCPAWVLEGDDKSGVEAARKEAMAAVRKAYFQRYVGAWQKMVGAVRYAKESGQLEQVYDHLTTAQRPQARLMKAIDRERKLEVPSLSNAAAGLLAGAKNTKLMKKLNAKATKAGVATEPKKEYVKAVFDGLGKPLPFFFPSEEEDAPPPPFEQYFANLQEARAKLAEREDPAAAKECARSVESFARQTEANIRQSVPKQWHQALKDLLLPPLEAVPPICKGTVACDFQTQWEDVYNEVREVTGQFPFRKQRSLEAVSPMSLAATFAPAGPVWTFFDNHIKSRVRYSGGRYRMKAGGSGAKIPGNLLAFYSAARTLTRGLGLDDKGKPTVRVRVKVDMPTNAVKGYVSYEGARRQLSTGAPQRNSFFWPKEGEGFELMLDFGGGSIVREGQTNSGWGLHAFLRRASDFKAVNAMKYNASWEVAGKPGQVVRLELNFDSKDQAALFHPRGKVFQDIIKNLSRTVVSGCN